MKSMNKKEGKKIAVMAAIIMGLMMFAFMPLASATVTSFTVTPSTGIAGVVDSYDVFVITSGVTSINITIPAGFLAVAPTPTDGGVEVARVDFWNSSSKAYYGYATITANNADPTTEVDIVCEFGGETATTPGIGVDYTAGETNVFTSGFECDLSSAIIQLPKADADGSINITINCTECPCFSDNWRLDAVTITIGEFVRNPLAAGDYDFFAEGVKETVTITAAGGRGIVFRDGGWYIDTEGNHVCDEFFWYGRGGDTPLIGDIDCDGNDDTIYVKDETNGSLGWYCDTDNNQNADKIFWYGHTGDIPLVGNINQQGGDDIIYVTTHPEFLTYQWYVDTDCDQDADDIFWYGAANMKPLVGDVDQDGDEDTVVVRNIGGSGYWIVDNDYSHDYNFILWYGRFTDIPLIGDVYQVGQSDMVAFRDGAWYVDRNHDEEADDLFWYGKAGDIPLIYIPIV